MPAASFIGAICSGHACFWPRPNAGPGAPLVLVNSIPIACLGDFYPPHNCFKAVDAGVIATASVTVHAMGRPVARMGDLISDTAIIAMGIPNIIVGG